MLYVFDLDDTLVMYKREIKVPRQTFHSLRNLYLKGNKIAVISYNPYGEFIINITGLRKYISISCCSNNLYRPELFSKIYNGEDTVYYFDDRKDNLEAVKERYPEVNIVHVVNPTKLHLIIKQIK